MNARLLLVMSLMLGSGSVLANPIIPVPLVGPPNHLFGSGAISSAGEVQAWTFDANPAGGTYTVTMNPLAAALQGTFEVFNPVGTIIASATGASAGATVLGLDLPLFLAGIWTIDVSGANVSTGAYNLFVDGNADAHILGHTAAIPEPTSIALLGLGLLGIPNVRRKFFRG